MNSMMDVKTIEALENHKEIIRLLLRGANPDLLSIQTNEEEWNTEKEAVLKRAESIRKICERCLKSETNTILLIIIYLTTLKLRKSLKKRLSLSLTMARKIPICQVSVPDYRIN